jgi:hypothetical protein
MPAKYVLFVHGIGPQQEHYSDGLVKQLWPGGKPADLTPHEVFYYDVFEELADKIQADTLAAQAAPFVNNLIKQFYHNANYDATIADIMQNCVAHVIYFLTITDIRNSIIAKFRKQMDDIVRHAAAHGSFFPDVEITVISHSLGTVVAYMGMHDIVHDGTLGLQQSVKVRNFYTLATPLELIRFVGSLLQPVLTIPNVATGIVRPVEVNPVTHKPKSNIVNWYSYRHNWDPVASTKPLKGTPPLDSADVDPYAFGPIQIAHTHDVDKYIAQAKADILAHV